MKQSDQWVFDARSRPVPPARSPSARAPVSQQHIGGQTNFSWSPPLSKWHPSNIQTQKCWARVLWVAPWLCPIGGWARVWSVIWNWLKSLTLDDSGQAGPRLAPDIRLGQPITGQYSGHVISLIQSEASVTSDTVVSTQPGPSVRVVPFIGPDSRIIADIERNHHHCVMFLGSHTGFLNHSSGYFSDVLSSIKDFYIYSLKCSQP